MRTQLLSLGSKWVTKVGFTFMIQKQSNNCCSGRAHNHQEQKKKKGMAWPEFIKSMLIVFSDVTGTDHREFVPPNATVNSDFNCDVLRRFIENVQ
jgi:hypothetical protein